MAGPRGHVRRDDAEKRARQIMPGRMPIRTPCGPPGATWRRGRIPFGERPVEKSARGGADDRADRHMSQLGQTLGQCTVRLIQVEQAQDQGEGICPECAQALFLDKLVAEFTRNA